jgi:hypothetical protein
MFIGCVSVRKMLRECVKCRDAGYRSGKVKSNKSGTKNEWICMKRAKRVENQELGEETTHNYK